MSWGASVSPVTQHRFITHHEFIKITEQQQPQSPSPKGDPVMPVTLSTNAPLEAIYVHRWDEEEETRILAIFSPFI